MKGTQKSGIESTMVIDMHTHTSRYSGCSFLDPADLVQRAEELNLAGIVITEHDYVWTEQEIEELRQQTGTDILILRGQEVSSPAGHMLVYGCSDHLENYSREELIHRVHDQGGVVIPSHPFRFGDFPLDSLLDLKKQLAGFDGFEALNGNQNRSQNTFGMHAWESLGITGIGGSDAHSWEMLGRYATEFQRDILNEHDLLAELKSGRCRPVNQHEVTPLAL